MTAQPPPYGTPEPERRPQLPEPGAPAPPPDPLRQHAEQRLKQQEAFRNQAFTFLTVNALLWVIWIVSAVRSGGGAWFPWPIFPTLGWGLAVLNNWRAAYGRRGITESDIQAELRRLRGE